MGGPVRFALMGAGVVLLASCAAPRGTPPAPAPTVSAPVPAAPVTFTPVDFAQLPGWKEADTRAALNAFARSCGVIARMPAATVMGGQGYGGVAADWQAVCGAVPQNADAQIARAFFADNFVPVAVRGGDAPDGLFTGYFEPEITGSRTRHGAYQTPVYGVPADLVSVDLGAFRPEMKGERIAGRVRDARLVPYDDRAAIETAGLNAPVLFYADDPVAVFFLQIQGSGRVRLDDGTSLRVGYAAQNGYAYTAIGRTLIAEGALTRENVSLQSIRDWLRAHPADAARVMQTNRSFVFFEARPVGDPAPGATGTQGVALTPRASIAIDARIHMLGAPFYLAAGLPGGAPLQALLVAQDTGGAIRGAVRADVFWGTGAEAEAMAGAMKQQGALYVLLPRALAGRLAR